MAFPRRLCQFAVCVCVCEHVRLFKVLSQQILMMALYAGRADMIIHILEAERAQLQKGTQGTLRQPSEVSCHREAGIDKTNTEGQLTKQNDYGSSSGAPVLVLIRSWGQFPVKCLAIKPCLQHLGESSPSCFLSSEQALWELGVQIIEDSRLVTWPRSPGELVAKSEQEAGLPTPGPVPSDDVLFWNSWVLTTDQVTQTFTVF